MPDRSDIGKHHTACLMQRTDDRIRRSDAGDHHLAAMPDHRRQIILQGLATNDEIRTERRVVRPERAENARYPAIEFIIGSAIGRRKRTDHASLARGNDEFRA
jgi:hypothetical protein